ncbi:MAG: hypothetical protein ACE5KF_09185 [Kiloniellaceae bacterium]
MSRLKDHLSAVLKKVHAGRSAPILNRIRSIARLERVEWRGTVDDRLDRLEREGLVRRAVRPVPIELLEESPPKPGKSVLEALIEERRAGR